MKFRKALFPFTFALALGGSLLLTGCDNNPANSNQAKLSTVNVQVFETNPLNYTVKVALPARVVASQIAEIRPQVGGIILKREFAESSNVTEGQSLYQIDPAIYQANYDSAMASVASAEASAKIAHLTMNRYKDLLKTKSISQQEFDKAAADAMQADASVLVAKANLNTAKVNLGYTKVYSPIDGYIGKSNVTEGALVSAGQSTAMAIVQKLDPIYIDMTQTATIFEKNEKERNQIYVPNEKVEIFFNDSRKYEYDGHIIFSDKNVNETTGTVILRAQFPNPNAEILPGMFLKPLLTLGNIENAILVPQKGITSDAAGNYTAIVAIPVPADQELTFIKETLLARLPKQDSESGMKENEQKAEQEALAIIKAHKESDKKDTPFYYFEKRNDVKVYAGISGYWIVTSGINAGEKVVISGLLNLSSIPNLNTPVYRTFANIVADPQSLTQEQLDTLIENSVK
ncbi:membrane fusion protein (multidrug efflux system) [Orbus hercynius]|uniref:Membrane fusion protein (Multidrug efflux system) n=1 Tax=Orbus hercynius TaxID=593135 RepID=A0A495RIW3_9GAMM|nr:efflux RND transporter periplasmic adaptor subunit [Orbus hercynius]RKS87214.1 membrane fusion protein (multidrug efflux system) [Orbus hercynius]